MDNFLAGLGPFREAYDHVDWASTPLGPTASWDDTLRNAVGLIVHTKFPVTLFWGSELVLVYNEAYVELIADKHPLALGAPASEVFPEAWHIIGPMMTAVLQGQPATWVANAYVPLHRRGFLEECYFTFSYSPVRSRDGVVRGVMDIAGETTEQVISRRRLELLGRLSEVTADVARVEDVPRAALTLLRGATADFDAVDIRVDGLRDPSAGLPEQPEEGWGPQTPVLEGDVAWLPLGAQRPREEHLVARLSPRLAPDQTYLRFLRLVAVSLGQALDRVRAREAQRRTAEVQRGIAEAFQRSLLPETRRAERPEVAVRYQPAVEQAHIGGDWYDLFDLPDGSLAVVVGDVAGHDQQAAAAMSQVRNMARGVAYTMQPATPAQVLGGLDRAIQGTSRTTFATAVLAQVGWTEAGRLRLTWSNAGHPPPVLVEPDGVARLLDSVPDLLLGVATADRSDHVVDLDPGATVVFYTDGLVERRGAPISRGIAWLVDILQHRHGLDVEEMCEHLLKSAVAVDDDVAVLVLRA